MKDLPRDMALRVVQVGYDQLGAKYSEERSKFKHWSELDAFVPLLPEGARVLDAGCGTGIPVAEYLVKSGLRVTGIDLSERMVEIARKNVPDATFIQMNMLQLDFPPESFDGIVSCFAIFHNPREMHAAIFESFHALLKPEGVMLVSIASSEWEEFAEYLGVDMFWSHFDPSKTKALIEAAGFDIQFGRDVHSGDETHHWVLARRV